MECCVLHSGRPEENLQQRVHRRDFLQHPHGSTLPIGTPDRADSVLESTEFRREGSGSVLGQGDGFGTLPTSLQQHERRHSLIC